MSGVHKVLVHVGAPKTGTSFVQELLFENRDTLAEQGILYPADRFDEHFLAALDLLELRWGGLEEEAVGAWDRLATRVREWPGTVIISHEILATASRQQTRRALDSFGDAEVHIVLSARDLARQIPAEWQENVKHRRVLDYQEFLDQITDPTRSSALASWFWGVQEVPDILDRWGSTLPAERVHLVTVPGRDAPRGLLWERFAGVLGLDPAAYSSQGHRTNRSLGVAESVLLRRINEQVNDRGLASRHYRELVRELLAHRSLSQRTASARLALPADVHDWAVNVSREWVEQLNAQSYDVVGALEELLPTPTPSPFVDPDAPDEAQVAAAGVQAITTLLDEAARLLDETARLRGSEKGLREELERTWTELEASRGLVFRAKRRLVLMAERNAGVGLALSAYRRLRGSSSRSA